jgi:hypothetical protein
MTISTTVSRADYTGNGSASNYTFSFKIFDEDELLVTVENLAGALTTLTLTTDYTVAITGSTGSITLVDADQAWLTGANLTTGFGLTIRRVMDLVQETDIRNAGVFYPETHEDQFDRSIMIDQQQQDELNRSLRVSEADASIGNLPSATERAESFLYFDADGEPTAVNTLSDSVVVSAFMETVLDDTTAGDALTTLGVTAFAQTLLDDATAAAARTTLGFTGASSEVAVENIDPVVFDHNQLSNISLEASVAANALTISVLQKSGSVCSTGAAAGFIGFRSSTATSGVYVQRSVTAALTMTVSSGSTLGTKSAVAQPVYIYAIDNAGTVELAVSGSKHFDTNTLQNTTEEGGAGGADDGFTLYSTTARSGVAVRLLGRLISTQATAGTWATAKTEIASLPLGAARSVASSVVAYGGNGHGSTDNRIRRFSTATTVGTAITHAETGVVGSTFTVNQNGLYHISYSDGYSVGTTQHGITVNSSSRTTNISSLTAPGVLAIAACPGANLYANASAVVRLQAGDILRAHTQGVHDKSLGIEIFSVTLIGD